MAERKLKPTETEQISAYLDGELSADQMADVGLRIENDPAWSTAAAELSRVDALLDAWQVQGLQRDLAGDIRTRIRRAPGVFPWRQAIAPLAAAAAIALAVGLSHLLTRGDVGAGDLASARPAAVLADVAEDDRLVVENLDLFEDYEVLANFATLEAIEELENPARNPAIGI